MRNPLTWFTGVVDKYVAPIARKIIRAIPKPKVLKKLAAWIEKRKKKGKDDGKEKDSP